MTQLSMCLSLLCSGWQMVRVVRLGGMLPQLRSGQQDQGADLQRPPSSVRRQGVRGQRRGGHHVQRQAVSRWEEPYGTDVPFSSMTVIV